MALAGAPIEFSTGSRYPLWPKCDAFSTGGGKKRKKKEPMVFRFNLSYARNLVHEPTYTRAREREREEDSSFSFLDLSLHSPDDK